MIIHRSILKELLINLLITVSFLSFVLFMEKLVRITRLVIGRGVELTDIIKVFAFLQPSILLFSIPMAILITTFLTYGRMASDNEIIALKSSGTSFWFISKPAIMLSAGGLITLLFITTYLLPKSVYSFKYTLYEVIAKKASIAIEEETFSSAFKGTIIFVKEMPSKNKFKGIFIYTDVGSSKKYPVAIVAEEGEILPYPEEGVIKLNMHNGFIHTFGSEGSSEITFKRYDLVLTSMIEIEKKKRLDEIGFLDLWKGRKGNVLWQIELNRRLSIPFACLIFSLLGSALSTKVGKIGRTGSFSLSLFLLVVYYFLLISGEGLAKTGRLSPFIGGWGPNILFALAGVLSFYMVYRDRPLFSKRFRVKS